METMKPADTCEVCGLDVDPATAVRAELTASGAMCPTPMNFHPQCYELASTIWRPEDEDSTCTVDRMFPETQQWPRASDPTG